MERKLIRKENKRRKLAALVNMIRLNDNDKKTKRDDDIDEEKQPAPKKFKWNTQNSESTEDGSSQSDIEHTKPSTSTTSSDTYDMLKKEIAERMNFFKSVPKLRLKMPGDLALLTTNSSERVPIFLTDIQGLLSNILIGKTLTPQRWYTLERCKKVSHTVVVIVEGLSIYEFSSHQSLLKETTKLFENQLEVILPPCMEQVMEDLLTVPLNEEQLNSLISDYGSLETALKSTQNTLWITKSIFPIDGVKHLDDEGKLILPKSDVYPRTQLLLSPMQMVDQQYPLPLTGVLSLKYKDYIQTKDVYDPVTCKSPMFGIDCEMCETKSNSKELTRITIVDEIYNIVYESLVRPEETITNYLTAFSGITKDMLKDVTKTLKDVQNDVRALLPADAILVGHSLESDLTSMRMIHPYIIDTSTIFNRTGDRLKKTKLKLLVKEFLNKEIQNNEKGHDSAEDSIYTLKLVQLKLTKNLEFGNVLVTNSNRTAELYKSLGVQKEDTKEDNGCNLLKSFREKDHTTTIINSMEVNADYQKYIDQQNKKNMEKNKITYIKTETNKKAIKKTCEVAIQNALTITHVKLTESLMEESSKEKSITKVDKWITKIHESVAVNALMVILLANSGSKTGVSLISLKKT